MTVVPLFRYFVFVGSALVGLIFAFEAITVSDNPAQPSASNQKMIASSSSRSSIDVLRAMAHHGEIRSTALAAASPLVPMPDVPRAAPSVVTAEAIAAPETKAAGTAQSPRVLDAQARVAAEDLEPKPVKKKAAARKAQNTNRYVENVQRGPFNLFGSIQAW